MTVNSACNSCDEFEDNSVYNSSNTAQPQNVFKLHARGLPPAYGEEIICFGT
jgi:hypothetical protein